MIDGSEKRNFQLAFELQNSTKGSFRFAYKSHQWFKLTSWN